MGLSSKQPKAVAGSVLALKEVVRYVTVRVRRRVPL